MNSGADIIPSPQIFKIIFKWILKSHGVNDEIKIIKPSKMSMDLWRHTEVFHLGTSDVSTNVLLMEGRRHI